MSSEKIDKQMIEARKAKWDANQAKVAFLQALPWILGSWEETIGRTIEQVIPIPEVSHSVALVFTDGSMIVAPHPISEPQTLTKGFLAGRGALESRHADTFATYDLLDRHDKAASRTARLHNILGAIRNNVDQIPELKAHLRALVHEWETKQE
ncbi:MAG: hypothetical protein D6690_09040 [Nitrospirae bacterium]|nr:MAG: hypothetical protein D6690_09040 [Nitrospirota bacterium]